MIKRKYLILWLLLLATMVLSSCSRKIIGATPHRRDRHCGCENIHHVPQDSVCLTPVNLSKHH